MYERTERTTEHGHEEQASVRVRGHLIVYEDPEDVQRPLMARPDPDQQLHRHDGQDDEEEAEQNDAEWPHRSGQKIGLKAGPSVRRGVHISEPPVALPRIRPGSRGP